MEGGRENLFPGFNYNPVGTVQAKFFFARMTEGDHSI